jgi:predicted Zn-dependent protease
MNSYTFYQMKPELRESLDLPKIPFPVRREKMLGFFNGGKLSLCKLLDELALYLHEHPDKKHIYKNAVGKLAWIEGLESGRQGFMEHACHYLKLGLLYEPEELSLRAEYAASLISLGKHRDALEELECLISRADKGVEPLIWLLAARLHHMEGNTARAEALLQELIYI